MSKTRITTSSLIARRGTCQKITHSSGNTSRKREGERFEIVKAQITEVGGSHRYMRGLMSIDLPFPKIFNQKKREFEN
jgi:hypothetical protein